MADEEDVDIIGNCEEILDISTGQLLSCDYTVHPKWVNEYAEGGDFWSDSVPKHIDLEKNVKVLHSEEIAIETPNDAVTRRLDWTAVETNEVMNEDNIIFDDDIPAALEEIVENQETPMECSEAESEICFPEAAAFETHPAPGKLKYIGPRSARSLLKVQLGSVANHECKSPSKFKSTLTIQSNFVKNKTTAKPVVDDEPKSLPKFKETFKIPRSELLLKQNEKQSKTLRKSSGGKVQKKKSTSTKSDFGENITIIHETADASSLSGWDPVTLTSSTHSNSDSDVDIESDDTVPVSKPSPMSIKVKKTSEKEKKSAKTDSKKLSEDLQRILEDTAFPTEELIIGYGHVSELERHIHSEFFDGRLTKSAEQYKRIRNHILDVWKATRPEYVSKTAVRSGLKHGGDVNCISRIHRLLEQIGAINFGYQGMYFEYVRPLGEYMSMFVQVPRSRSSFNDHLEAVSLKSRSQRRKHSYNLLKQHGPMRNLNVPPIIRPLEKDLEIVKCIKIHSDNNSLVKVVINLSTFLCLQLHSLSSRNEVMGFIGGHSTKIDGKETIQLMKYKPLCTTEQTDKSCETCTLSQLEQSQVLTAEGLDVIAWFHSHPKFAADPSRRDVRSQQTMQLQFVHIIGVIFSCLDASLKCFRLLPSDLDSEGEVTPFELSLLITRDFSDLKTDIWDVLSVTGRNKEILMHKLYTSSEKILNRLGINRDLIFKDIL